MMPRAVSLRVPGDKSIGHRSLIVAALAPGPSRISGLPDGADVRGTARALSAAGVDIDWPPGSTDALVTPPETWRSGAVLDCGNSGTTVRLLAGVFAGLGLAARLDGDASLRDRPMDRVVYPLQAMGARISYEGEHDRLPIQLARRATGGLRVLRYRPRVASAQVKGALVLAALTAGVEFEMWEAARTRDHTERLLRHLDVPIEFGAGGSGGGAGGSGDGRDDSDVAGTYQAHLWLPAQARRHMKAADLSVPGDPSSAAFLLAAGIMSGRETQLHDLLLNETRTGYLEVFEHFGAEVEIEIDGMAMGEPVGSVTAGPGSLTAVRLEPEDLPGLIDEIPILAVLASRAAGVSAIRGAGELRVKESDRLAALAENLRAVGAEVREWPDGLDINGRPDTPPAGDVRTYGDHRIAMAFGALNVVPGADVRLDDPSCVAVSYPGFWDDLGRLGDGA